MSMRDFGETIRQLRTSQDLGLRETAVLVGISPAYLSRIERGKENPPRPEIIKELAKVLAADPDVLFRLSSYTDPDLINFLNSQPMVMNIIRFIKNNDFSEAEVRQMLDVAESFRAQDD